MMRQPAGVILAGGRSSRMGGVRKALLELGGRALLAHVIDRLRTQADPLLISCEAASGDFDGFGLEYVPDLLPGHLGPLTGLYSTLQFLSERGHDSGLVLCPCDAPFLPENLVQTLQDESREKIRPVVAVSWQGVLQPTFSLWQNHHLPVIRSAVHEQGMGGIKQVLLSVPHKIVEWENTEPPPFFNVNTPGELESAALWLDRPQT
ncbi:MAG: molybdenum cofactor guanylyltransferase [Lysobacterales bacterium]